MRKFSASWAILCLLAAMVSSMTAQAQNYEVYTSYALPDGVLGIFVEGNLAYIANDQTGIQIIDITDPYVPFIVGFLETPGFARGILVRGGYAYVADGDSGLTIINVTTPSTPTFVGNYSPESGTALSVAVPSGNYAYLTNGYSGMLVIDISNPLTPTLTGTYTTPGYLMGVSTVGSYAFVTANFVEPDYGEL